MITIGTIGLILSVIGLALNANHRHVAQRIFVCGNILWLAYGLERQLTDVIAAQAIYLALNIRTVRAWSSEVHGGGKVIIAEES